MNLSTCLPITEITQIGEARRRIAHCAVSTGLSETLRGQLAIIVVELANNLVKHTPAGGCLIFRPLNQNVEIGVEILALDQGPGMKDVVQCMRDGYSTAGSPGTGLGAIRRLSTHFDIYSFMGAGTAILSQVCEKNPDKQTDRKSMLSAGAICIPVHGETACGDEWALEESQEFEALAIADGLGHGPEASKAAHASMESFKKNSRRSPAETLQAAHLALRGTRGAAVAITRIDFKRSLIQYSGVGNTVGVILSRDGQQRRMISHNGTAGAQVKKIQEFEYPWEPTSILVLHTDGLATHWNLEKYPGLLNRHPSLIAGVLYRDFKRGNDDVTVLVAKAAGK